MLNNILMTYYQAEMVVSIPQFPCFGLRFLISLRYSPTVCGRHLSSRTISLTHLAALSHVQVLRVNEFTAILNA